MRQHLRLIVCAAVAISILMPVAPARAELTSEQVLTAIKRGSDYLLNSQTAEGSWSTPDRLDYQLGISSLALLSLINSGMTIEDEPIARGLGYLRKVSDPASTYELSLMIMVFAAAKDGERDLARIITLAAKLESSQINSGNEIGSWGYRIGSRLGGDRSNGQFAILGLREAQHAGAQIDQVVWERAQKHWEESQNIDGGWFYSAGESRRSTGSMTVAGVATLSITEEMLHNRRDEGPPGEPVCCGDDPPSPALARGIAWLEREKNFAVGHNPGSRIWLLYYLYGLERAGRLSGRRFFGSHDWYREGAEYLLRQQSQRNGSWEGKGPIESDPVVGTSLALLFLSKGLAPVLINKLQFGEPNPPVADEREAWNVHGKDIRNLTERISGLPKWPKLVTWQQIDIARVSGVQDLMQAPVLFFNGSEDPNFSDRDIELLREFVTQGGFLLTSAACERTGFDRGFRALIGKMYPDGDHTLKRLTAEHPVFRSEYLLNPSTTEIWGVDVGCRTSIMYLPQDIPCLWDKWSVVTPKGRSAQLQEKVTDAMKVGVNIVAYATGREPPNKLDLPTIAATDRTDRIERGFLQVAKLRHSGGWDAAPQALHNLLVALNTYAGASASERVRDLPATDPNLFRYPLLYMHGRNRFSMSEEEREHLRDYLKRGGVLFADACCGAPQFDRGFRELMVELFPANRLDRIPAEHEIFTTTIGHDLSRVRRRELITENANATLESRIVNGEPYLEGIKVDGRYVVIYSRYDISCALERQASDSCPGYLPEDAVKLAVNVVLYALEP